MSIKSIANASITDAAICNLLDPPGAGCDAGAGLHVIIPANFVALIAAGQDVPGCSYSRVDADGSLVVSDAVQAKLATPSQVARLSAAQQAQAATLINELQTASSVGTQTQLSVAK